MESTALTEHGNGSLTRDHDDFARGASRAPVKPVREAFALLVR